MIRRQKLQEIYNHLKKPEMTFIVGARQVGKTTIMKQLIQMLKTSGEKTLFLNFDFESDYAYVSSQEKLMQKIRLEFGESSGYVFLDEIQRKENAGLFLKGLYDKDLPYKFVVSGSGSMELKERIHESLAGRKRVFELTTISLWEFLQYKTAYAYADRLLNYIELEGGNVELLLQEYLSFGGYPRIVIEQQSEEKLLLMNEIYESYLKKDIAYLLNLERADVFTTLIRLLAHSCGSLLNYSTLAADAGLSVPTLKKYLWYAEQTYIIKRVMPFYKNKRKELKKSPMIYFTDLGLRNFALNAFGHDVHALDTGRLFQNLVFLLLHNILNGSFFSIHYWRTSDQAEVDFVIQGHGHLYPIEVKHSHLKREKMTRSLRNFIETYQPAFAFVVNLNYEKVVQLNQTTVKYTPWYKLYDKEWFSL